MKRIITAGLILLLFNQVVLAKDLKKADILSDRLLNVSIELTKLGEEFARLELHRDGITDQTLAAAEINECLIIYNAFCKYERQLLLIYPFIKDEEKHNVAQHLYKTLEGTKAELDYGKNLFWQCYSVLVRKSAFYVADKIKIQIEKIDVLYNEILNFYKTQR